MYLKQVPVILAQELGMAISRARDGWIKSAELCGCGYKLGVPLLGVIVIRALLLGDYIRALIFGNSHVWPSLSLVFFLVLMLSGKVSNDLQAKRVVPTKALIRTKLAEDRFCHQNDENHYDYDFGYGHSCDYLGGQGTQ